jgi:hypothetical protein
VVYFGGKSSDNETNAGEIFAILDLGIKDFKLENIQIPIDVSYGKAIDDILIMNNKLLHRVKPTIMGERLSLVCFFNFDKKTKKTIL